MLQPDEALAKCQAEIHTGQFLFDRSAALSSWITQPKHHLLTQLDVHLGEASVPMVHARGYGLLDGSHIEK